MPSAEFENAATAIKSIPKKPSDQELLKLYGLYKQATAGDNTTPKPGMLDFRGKMKWQAWTDRKGMSQEDAEKEYIAYVNELLEKHSK